MDNNPGFILLYAIIAAGLAIIITLALRGG